MYKKIEVGEKYSPIHSWREGNPYTTAFCRTLYSGNIMVCGGYKDVQEYIKRLGPCLVSVRFWYRGETRGSVTLKNVPRGLYFSHCRELLGSIGRNGNTGWDLLQFSPSETGPYKVLAHYSHIPSTFPRILVQIINAAMYIEYQDMR